MRGAISLATTLPHGGTAAARLVDGVLEDLLVDPPPGDPAPHPGAIYRGVLGRPMKGLGGAMVDLGQGRSGFLRETRGLAPGRPVLVQVAGWAEREKAPPLSRRLLVKGRLAILTIGAPGHNLARSLPEDARPRLEALARRAMEAAPAEIGLILRSAAATAEDDEILAEIENLRAQLAALEPGGAPACLLDAARAADEARRDWPEPPPPAADAGGRTCAFAAHGVWEAIDRLREPLVPLPGGGSFYIEPTRSLVAVDVNTGGDTSPAAGLKANIATARQLPRELRLRGLGGTIVIDFAPLAKSERQRVSDVLKAALARDGIATTIAGFTPLGSLELSRKRVRRPLADLLAGLL